jgi:Asp-tRNA(Asn)/Glu-tRNA(Gln) amidotransferase A subunit family amidase
MTPSMSPVLEIHEDELLLMAEDSKARWNAGRALSALDGIPVIVASNIDVVSCVVVLSL